MAGMARLPIALLLLQRALAQPTCQAPLSLNTSTLFTTEPYFASWNVDASRDRLFFDVDFSTPQLVYLASQLSNTHIRFGGTGNDHLAYSVPGSAAQACAPGAVECLNTSTIGALWGLASAASNGLVLGLNIHPPNASSPPKGSWAPGNARALLTYLRTAQLQAPAFVELGNEQNTIMTAQQQAQAMVVLSSLLDDVYGAGSAARPRLAGPDPHSFRDAGSSMGVQLAYIKEYLTTLAASSVTLTAATHHEYVEIDYLNVLNASFLDTTATIAAQVMRAVRSVSADVQVWAGEVGPHNGGTNTNGAVPNCADNRVCGRFGSALWYADSMSSKAKAGYAAYCRQDFIGADYGLVNYTTLAPTADYYLLLLWKRLVGARVLSVAQPAERSTRAYAFCAAPGAAGAGAGAPSGSLVTLVLVNLAAEAVCYSAPAATAPGASLTQFTLTAGAGGVESADTLFNGVPLALDGAGKLPAMPGMSLPAAQGITLPPVSVSLVLLPVADAQVCA